MGARRTVAAFPIATNLKTARQQSEAGGDTSQIVMSTILIADDNEDLRQSMVLRLRNRGFEVVEAENGREALELARSSQPAVILMDLNMPELDGWEATCQLRLDPALNGIPVIALTAYSLPGDRTRAMSAGCSGFYTKPVDLDELLADIERLGNCALE